MRTWKKVIMGWGLVGQFLIGAQQDVVIHQLPEELALTAPSLNPDYAVFGEGFKIPKSGLPLLITLHGAGGVGTDIHRVKRQANGILKMLERLETPVLVVAPQAAKSPRKEGAKGGWVPRDLNVLIQHLFKTLSIDRDRVYLTGTSMGGYGTLAWAATSPEVFAAIAPMVGGLGPLGPKDVSKDLNEWGRNLARIPMRAYYGENDRVVPPDRGAMILAAIEQAGGKNAEVIVLKGLGHDAARRPYQDPEFFEWLLAQRRLPKTVK